MIKVAITSLALFFGSIVSMPVLAHGGGLDSNGGHFNRKTGVYHCHRSYCGSTQRQPSTLTNSRQPAYRSQTTPSITQIRTAQTLLITLGYDIDKADGILGIKTKTAVTNFQKDRLLKTSGVVNDTLILELSSAIKNRRQSSG